MGFYTGFSHDKKRVYCIDGNQGNQVSLSAYPREQILGFRRLEMVKVPKFSRKNIKSGDTSKEVAMLQNALKQLGNDCGTSDGVFDLKIEKSINDFQASNRELQINEVLDKES